MKYLRDHHEPGAGAPATAPTILRSALGIMALATSMMLAACGIQTDGAPAHQTNSGTGSQPASARPVTIPAGNCLDGTSSSARADAGRMRALVADAVAGWAPGPAAHPVDAVPAMPGLHLVMRSVTTNSYTTDGLSVDETIPAVPALAAQPRPESDPNFDRDIHAWPGKMSAWKKAATAASTVDAQIVGQLRRFQIARHTWSGIYSCIAAAVAQLGTVAGLHARIAVESDMMNNRPVVGLHLSGDALLLVTICPATAAASCPRRFAAAREYLLRHGAASVEIVRSDAATPATFEAFWRDS